MLGFARFSYGFPWFSLVFLGFSGFFSGFFFFPDFLGFLGSPGVLGAARTQKKKHVFLHFFYIFFFFFGLSTLWASLLFSRDHFLKTQFFIIFSKIWFFGHNWSLSQSGAILVGTM